MGPFCDPPPDFRSDGFRGFFDTGKCISIPLGLAPTLRSPLHPVIGALLVSIRQSSSF
jgi:hypothetical protein